MVSIWRQNPVGHLAGLPNPAVHTDAAIGPPRAGYLYVRQLWIEPGVWK